MIIRWINEAADIRRKEGSFFVLCWRIFLCGCWWEGRMENGMTTPAYSCERQETKFILRAIPASASSDASQAQPQKASETGTTTTPLLRTPQYGSDASGSSSPASSLSLTDFAHSSSTPAPANRGNNFVLPARIILTQPQRPLHHHHNALPPSSPRSAVATRSSRAKSGPANVKSSVKNAIPVPAAAPAPPAKRIVIKTRRDVVVAVEEDPVGEEESDSITASQGESSLSELSELADLRSARPGGSQPELLPMVNARMEFDLVA